MLVGRISPRAEAKPRLLTPVLGLVLGPRWTPCEYWVGERMRQDCVAQTGKRPPGLRAEPGGRQARGGCAGQGQRLRRGTEQHRDAIPKVRRVGTSQAGLEPAEPLPKRGWTSGPRSPGVQGVGRNSGNAIQHERGHEMAPEG